MVCVDYNNTAESNIKKQNPLSHDRALKDDKTVMGGDKLPILTHADMEKIVAVLSEHVAANREVICNTVMNCEELFVYDEISQQDDKIWMVGKWVISINEDNIYIRYIDPVFPTEFTHIGKIDIVIIKENDTYCVTYWDARNVLRKYTKPY